MISKETLNEILQVLGSLPYVQVAGLIQKIGNELKSEVQNDAGKSGSPDKKQ